MESPWLISYILGVLKNQPVASPNLIAPNFFKLYITFELNWHLQPSDPTKIEIFEVFKSLPFLPHPETSI